MEFIIFGAGYRGKRLQEYLGSENVIAYIDSNQDRQKELFCGKPIISLEKYIQDYYDIFLIISSVYAANEIEELLISRGIYHFTNSDELPTEFSRYGNYGFIDRCNQLSLAPEENYYIYGFNAFSLMIYELLKKKVNKVHIILNQSLDNARQECARKRYGDIIVPHEDTIKIDKKVVFLAVREEEELIEQLFPSTKIIDAFDYTANMPEYYNEKINPLRGACSKRKRCFIVATGPSLRDEDLQSLNRNEEFCISMNKIYIYKGEWRPDVYVCVDSFLISESEVNIKEYTSKIKFIGDSCQQFWDKEHENTYKIHCITQDSYNVVPRFSEDICQKVYTGSTVAYACIQIAVFLGFKEIYLLGVDCNYVKNSSNNYFFESDVADNKNHHEDRMILSYMSAKKYADEHGIKIYNATRGGALEVFERVDFDSLFDGGK